MNRRRRARWLGVTLPLLTTLVRVAWLARFPADPVGAVDAEGYHLIARNLLAGRGFAMTWEAPFCATAVRTPLYPLFLAGVYGAWGLDPARAVLAQVLLEVLTTALVVRLGREAGGRRVGMLAGLLYALNGTTQRYTGQLFAETLLLTTLTATLCVTVRAIRSPKRVHAITAGLLWGPALLAKPNVQYLALTAGFLITFAPSLHVSRFTFYISRALLFTFGLLLITFPWLIRNRRLLDRWTLSTAFQENVARVSAVATLAEARGLRVEPWTPSWDALYGELVDEAAQRYDWEGRAEPSDACAEERRRHREVAVVAGKVLRTYPLAALRAHLRGVGRSLLNPGHRTWYPTLTGRRWATTGVVANVWRRMGESLRIGAVGDALYALWLERIARPPLGATLLWWGLLAGRVSVWGTGLRGWRRLLRHPPGLAYLLAATVLYVVLLPGPIAHDRFYLPAVPAVTVLVAISLTKKISLSGPEGAQSEI